MAIYHISKIGDPALCTATTRGCPLGGEHFSSLVDAKNYLEAKELKRSRGSFTQVFSKSKRERMAATHPKMDYTVDIEDSVYDLKGNEWVVVSKYYGRTEEQDHMIPTIALAKVNGSDEVVLDPYDSKSTHTIDDFVTPVPKPVILDSLPIRDSEKFSEIPKGRTYYNNVRVQRIPIKTTLDGKYENRFLLVENTNDKNYYTQKEMLEIGEAMWKQTGRSLVEWEAKSKPEKLKYFDWNGAEYKRLRVDNTGTKIRFSAFNAKKEPYQAVEPAPANEVIKYTI